MTRRTLREAWPLLPALAWLVLFCLLPLLLIAAFSLGHRTEGGGVEFGLTVEHYRRLAESVFYLRVLWRSLVIGLMVTVATLLAGYPVAYFIATARAGVRPLLIALLIIPWWCNILVKNFAWIAILGENGTLNLLLKGWGLIERPLMLVHNEGAVVLGLVHVLLPFMVLPIYASLDRMDSRLIEAAGNMGAGPVRAFVEVTGPLSLPGVMAGCVLSFVLAFGSYITPVLLGSERTLMISKIIEDQFMTASHWPFGSAIAVVLLILVVGVIAVLNRLVGIERVWGTAR